ncbi:PSD1 and planctomycete cytochrome C domain-containing protein [Armatimonas sp.]|uniref:PSD1 and planctomycete cytochrome C domain-containing protein n=1 Tax=Armatimonas sp. TaxID=1872638 RepID=UPI00375186AE
MRKFMAALPLMALFALGAAGQKVEKTVSFREEVEPLLKADCTGCHSGEAKQGGFSVEGAALFGGGSKFLKRVIVPGKPAQSALIGYLRGKHQPQMPIGMPPLKEAQIQTIERWIAQGARVDAAKQGWPYTAPVNPAAPRVKNPVMRDEWVANPIDSFVLAKLEAKKLFPSPPADKTTLLRRVYLDLVGLPPTPQEAEAFLADTAPGPYEKLVDRLLADPRYGERWGRHWLDLVRYAETHGFEADNIRSRAWRYRDYVIRSFNTDKPYDKFLAEQLAGDLLSPKDSDALIATGFARLGSWDELSRDPAGRWQDYLNDATDTVGSVMLGMTVGCARCHDHKYDQITARDYYRLQGFFANTRWSEERLTGEVDSPELMQRRRELQEELKEKRVQQEAERAEKGDAEEPKRKRKKEGVDAEIDALNRELSPIDTIAETVTDKNNNPITHKVLVRGSLTTPGDIVKPGFIASLSGGKEVDVATGKARLELARWVGSPQNPLTARVIANRLWQHHFGQGIVATPSDFGRNGSKPTHTELLDWLATTLIQKGWSLKKLHKVILTSATYRQSVGANPVAAKLDPANTLLWRQRRQRLEGESIRDSILAVSGQLNLQMSGPSIYPRVSGEVLATGSTHKWGSSPEDQQRRRTVYVFQRRSLSLPMTEVFDGPDMVNTCPKRQSTTIAPQALAMFNGEFGWEQARHFAERVAKEAGSDSAAQITLAYRLALVRKPTPTQLAQATAFLAKKAELHRDEKKASPQQAALADFCHVLFNTNEFLYAD